MLLKLVVVENLFFVFFPIFRVFCMNIYVGNLPFSAEESEIRSLFEQYGEVQSLKFVNDRETGRFRGFGFIEMDDDAGRKAIEELDQQEMGERKIVVNEAKQDRGGGGGGNRRRPQQRRNY